MPVEAKVKASTAAAAAAGLAVWLLSRYVFHGHVDPVVQAEIYAAAPGILAFAAGYFARHTARPKVVTLPMLPPVTVTPVTVPMRPAPPDPVAVGNVVIKPPPAPGPSA
jgi:hypothetical protein